MVGMVGDTRYEVNTGHVSHVSGVHVFCDVSSVNF